MNSRLMKRAGVAGALVGVLTLMLLDTKFLTPEEVEAMRPEQFDPEVAAQELMADAPEELLAEPVGIGELVEVLDEDPEEAAQEFEAFEPSEGTTVYAVRAEGVVQEATEDRLILAVDGVEEGRDVVIPLDSAVDGNLIRDLLGFQFGDAPGQTEYQRVGTELSALLRSSAQDAVGEDPSEREGEDIMIEGVLRVVSMEGGGSSDRPLIILPLAIEAS